MEPCNICPFVSGFFCLASDFQGLSNCIIPFYSCIIFHCMGGPYFLIRGHLDVFPLFGNNCCDHLGTGFCGISVFSSVNWPRVLAASGNSCVGHPWTVPVLGGPQGWPFFSPVLANLTSPHGLHFILTPGLAASLAGMSL
jgi:hypothetical protein